MQRTNSPLCLSSKCDSLMPWHTPRPTEIAASPIGERQNVFIVNYESHPPNSKRGALCEQALDAFETRGKRIWKLRRASIWLEQIIQTWLSPAGLHMLLSSNRSPREIHSNTLQEGHVERLLWDGGKLCCEKGLACGEATERSSEIILWNGLWWNSAKLKSNCEHLCVCETGPYCYH